MKKIDSFIRIEVNGVGLFRAILAPSKTFDYKTSHKMIQLADNEDFESTYQILSRGLDHMYGSKRYTLKHYSHFTELGYRRFKPEIEVLVSALSQAGFEVTINHTIGLAPIIKDKFQAVVIKGYKGGQNE